MSIFSGMDICASGLTAQRTRMDVITENIVNVDTTRTADGTPYTRRYVVMEDRSPSFSAVFNKSRSDADVVGARLSPVTSHENHFEGVGMMGRRGVDGYGGVRISEIGEDDTPYKIVYDPDNPDADENGYVQKPNVDTAQEMVDLMSAYRSYEANVTAFQVYKDMAVKTFEIGV